MAQTRARAQARKTPFAAAMVFRARRWSDVLTAVTLRGFSPQRPPPQGLGSGDPLPAPAVKPTSSRQGRGRARGSRSALRPVDNDNDEEDPGGNSRRALRLRAGGRSQVLAEPAQPSPGWCLYPLTSLATPQRGQSSPRFNLAQILAPFPSLA